MGSYNRPEPTETVLASFIVELVVVNTPNYENVGRFSPEYETSSWETDYALRLKEPKLDTKGRGPCDGKDWRDRLPKAYVGVLKRQAEHLLLTSGAKKPVYVVNEIEHNRDYQQITLRAEGWAGGANVFHKREDARKYAAKQIRKRATELAEKLERLEQEAARYDDLQETLQCL